MADKVTPMMAQYLEIKSEYEDALLFYRMGDFYELFFDDAIAAAAALDIALTKRGKHQGNDIPMCGVPVHAAEGYLLTLIRKGFRVAVCEQMEDPAEAKKRGSKSVVRRAVVRLVTPGTLTEDSLLEARRHNYLAAWAPLRDGAALAWVDISTGALRVTGCALSSLGSELARLAPREILVPEDALDQTAPVLGETDTALTPLHRGAFDSQNAQKRLCDLFKVENLDGFGAFDRAEIAALGGLVEYLEITQKGQLPRLAPPERDLHGTVMQIDGATRRSLELTRGPDGGRAGSLLAEIDHSCTAAGARLMERRLASPSCDLDELTARHDAVEHLVGDARLRETLREHLRQIPDIERALSRLALDRAGPRDMAALGQAIAQAAALRRALPGELPPALEQTRPSTDLDTLGALLAQALIDEPPLLARDGGFVRPGYLHDLDAARQLRDEGRGIIAQMQAAFAEETGIGSLKVKHNNVLGYFIEVTALHGDKMRANDRFIHRQTTASQVRFTTLELKDLESRILNAAGHSLELERSVFRDLRTQILTHEANLGHLARCLAQLDVCAALAELASTGNWVRPQMDASRDFEVVQGRHPVVEAALRREQKHFVANDCTLSQTPIWLLTGPNMAGKSTFLRQNALIAVLAHMGGFVPAASARIGIVTQLFSRVGASDDLARGRSTFMVEMVETAAILNQADAHSLVILDEIGRGTATYDGLSIAWATLEHLHNVSQCRALFATHYHEMTELCDRLEGVDSATVSVQEHQGEIVFLHEVTRGRADRSYGVQVAQLAGLPASVIARAQEVLNLLERQDDKQRQMDELPLFAAAAPVSKPSPAEDRLRGVDPDAISARDALDLIYELRNMVDQ